MNTAPFIADRFGRKIVLIYIAIVLAISIAIECAARHWGVWVRDGRVSKSDACH